MSSALVVAVLMVAGVAVGCTVGGPPEVGELSAPRPSGPAEQTSAALAGDSDLAVHTASRGRFRLAIEVGVEGYGVVDTEVVGSFDHDAGAVEVAIDLHRLVAGAPHLVPTPPPDLAERVLIRQVDGMVFLHAGPAPGWLLLPGSLHETLGAAGIVHPDRLLALLDRTTDGVVAVDGGVIDGEVVTLYSGWVRSDAAAGLGGAPAFGAIGHSLAGMAPVELLDRMVRFDAWVDRAGRVRRLVIEADLESMAELARRVDGTDEGIDRLRLRYEVDWFDLDDAVSIEAPPMAEVSVIDLDALLGEVGDGDGGALP